MTISSAGVAHTQRSRGTAQAEATREATRATARRQAHCDISKAQLLRIDFNSLQPRQAQLSCSEFTPANLTCRRLPPALYPGFGPAECFYAVGVCGCMAAAQRCAAFHGGWPRQWHWPALLCALTNR